MFMIDKHFDGYLALKNLVPFHFIIENLFFKLARGLALRAQYIFLSIRLKIINMLEKDIENLLARYTSEFITQKITLVGQQVRARL